MTPNPINEQIQNYAIGTPERAALKQALTAAKENIKKLKMHIGGKWIETEKKSASVAPHQHGLILGYVNEGDTSHVDLAISAALKAKPMWERFTFEERAAVFLKAADLVSGPYRYKINAATMLGQSKNAYQAELDAACELADFLRFNVKYASQIYQIQPNSSPGVWNRMEYRPLEGFVYALTPFNFTAIAGNLAAAPALMGNTIVWKPAYTQAYSAQLLMEIWIEAGLPDGVINLIYVDGEEAGKTIFTHRDFGGLHFTGSTKVFQSIWKMIGENISNYKSYPRIVGETGGKDFVLAHVSADAKAVATGLIRGAFEYQGQKCSAASRAYIADNLWPEVKDFLLEEIKTIKMGSVENFENFVNAVIDEKSFDRLAAVIDEVHTNPQIKILAGGTYDKSIGYFVEPTILLVSDPKDRCMQEEFFGPILSIYVYPELDYDTILDLIDQTSIYALTGAIFARDSQVVSHTLDKLRNAAGNFYINDKPTGAQVDQQPFGGARGSGTNDKAGSMLNLLRWVSPRTIKQTSISPTDYRYPFMDKE